MMHFHEYAMHVYGGGAFEMVQIEERKRGFGRISCEKTEMSKQMNGMEWGLNGRR
jgi:hypothetical protein